MSHSSEILAVQSLDTEDLLNHIAWTDVIRPEIDKHRRVYSSYLTSAVLGRSIPSPSGEPYTPEQLAGIVFGFDFIENLFTQILRKGKTAMEDLKVNQGLVITRE